MCYLADLCVSAASTDGRRQSRSAVSGAFLVPWIRTSTGQRSFAVHGLRTWNRLLAALRSPGLHASKRQEGSSVPALIQWWQQLCPMPPSGAVVTFYSDFGAVYKYPDWTELNWTSRLFVNFIESRAMFISKKYFHNLFVLFAVFWQKIVYTFSQVFRQNFIFELNIFNFSMQFNEVNLMVKCFYLGLWLSWLCAPDRVSGTATRQR